jgi:isopenicillin N synthase-like dioxygenase
MSHSVVPVIDIEPYRIGDTAAKRGVAEQVESACRDIGFLTIIGHGVPDALTTRCYNLAKQFFDLPASEKNVVARPRPDTIRGYSGVANEGLSYTLGDAAPPDLKESFDIGSVDFHDAGDVYFYGRKAGPHFAPNIWPDRPPEMTAIFTAYFRAMERLSVDLMRLFALSLRLPENFFDAKIDKSINILRVLNYPDQPDQPLPRQLRAGAHCDYGGLTIVRQEVAPGGLQVRNQAGEWTDVAPVPGAFVVNIGDLMMRWTNDRWVSTLHRVANPPRVLARRSRRISLVFFQTPNYDASIECIPTCVAPGEVAKYDPITAGDYLTSKFVQQTTFSDASA